MTPEPPIPLELWDQVPPAAQAALLVLLQQYQRRIAALEERVRDLEERLAQNSTNSSRPPSSDPPAVKRPPPRPPSGRTKGGQPGHPMFRPPPLAVTRTESFRPAACRRCGHALFGDDPAPLCHRVIELPSISPEVIEYRLHRLCCPRCGDRTRAGLPRGVTAGRYGPRLQAVLALLTGAYRLSKRHVEELCADLFGVPVSAGQVCALEQQTAAALAPVVAELRAYVQTQPANMDETGWREGSQRCWLWVVATAAVTVFHIAGSRAGKVVRDLLGPLHRRVVTSDRFSAYNWLPLGRRQLCWAHLRRDFQAMVDRGNAGSAVGGMLLGWAKCVFAWWPRVRDGTLSRASFRRYLGPVRARFREDLESGAACACAKTAAVCRELLAVEPALWTFARVEGVEPTNNAAERALRHTVQWRKTNFGTDSEVGSRFVERIMSVVATCRQQRRNVLDYLAQCCGESGRGGRPPSLVPQAVDR
jgi:transposase